jgi:hypothetical protein
MSRLHALASVVALAVLSIPSASLAADPLKKELELIAFFAAATEPNPARPEPASPAAIPDSWAPPPAEDTPEARFALVWGNAELRRSPDDPSPLRAYDYPDEERERYPDAVFAVRVIGETDDGLLEIRLGGNSLWGSHCVGSAMMEHWMAVRGWIEPSDRVEVLAEEDWVEFPDGTGVLLMPGTPLIGDQGWLNGQLVPLSAGARRAFEYPGDARRLEQGFGSGRIPWTTTGAVGGEPFAVRQPVIDRNDALGLSSFEATETGTLARYTRRCGEVRFLTDAAVTEDTRTGILGALMGNDDSLVLAAGTPLFWIDGQPAGQVGTYGVTLESWQFFGEQMRCVDVRVSGVLRDRKAPTVPICVRPEDVESP